MISEHPASPFITLASESLKVASDHATLKSNLLLKLRLEAAKDAIDNALKMVEVDEGKRVDSDRFPTLADIEAV